MEMLLINWFNPSKFGTETFLPNTCQLVGSKGVGKRLSQSEIKIRPVPYDLDMATILLVDTKIFRPIVYLELVRDA